MSLRFPDKPSVVITASPYMVRTASTWVFNAVRLLYRQAGEACDEYWIRQLSKERLGNTVFTGADLSVKTHENPPRVIESLAPMFSHVLVSVREGLEPDQDWMAITHVTKFEQIVAGGDVTLGVLRRMAEDLGINGLSDNDLRTVDYELMTMPIPGHQTFKSWSLHSQWGGLAQPSVLPAFKIE